MRVRGKVHKEDEAKVTEDERCELGANNGVVLDEYGILIKH